MNFANLSLVVPKNIKTNKVPFLVGEPGIGKSSWIEDFATKLGTRCFCLAVNQLADKADVTGARLVPVGKDKNGNEDYAQKFYPHIIIRKAVEYAENHPDETPILFLDEINRSTPDVTSEALSIPTMRSIGDMHLPPNLKVMCAGNDKGNVCSLDDASVSRFVLYKTEPDVATFVSANANLNPWVATVLKKNPTYIFQKPINVSGSDDEDDDPYEVELDGTLEQFTTPRTITAVSDFLNECSYDELMQFMNTPDGDGNMLMSVLSGHTGDTPFTLALVDEIISNPPAGATVNADELTEPANYQVLKNAKSRDELIDAINDLDENEKVNNWLYAICENADNKNLITTLTPALSKCPDMGMLGNLKNAGKIDSQNLEYALECDTKLMEALRVLIK